MPELNRLPGVIVRINDGGLRVTPPVSSQPRVLIIGTAGKGPAYTPILTTSLMSAKSTFGSSGTLLRKLAEVYAGGGDNVVLFRVGSTATTIEGIGYASSGDPGITVTFEDHSPTIGSDYMLCYKDGVLSVYTTAGTCVYSDNPDDPIDLNLVSIDGTAAPAATGASYFIGEDYSDEVTWENSVLVSELDEHPLSGYAGLALEYGDDGTDISVRRLYEVCYTAFALMDGYDSDIVMIAGAYADNPNVAYFENIQNTTLTIENDPTGDDDVLGWLRIEANNESTELFDYYWSEEVSEDPAAMAVSLLTSTYLSNYGTDPDSYPITFSDADDRLAKEFYEVSFPHLLANYCYQMTKNNNEMLGVIAMRGPRTAKLYDVNRWVGVSPTYDSAGVVTSDGSGLLGFPLTMGCSNSRLNILVYGQSNGRIPGLFATDDEHYEGTTLYDDNNYKIDIGAYLSIVGEYPVLAVGNFPYVGPIDGMYCGMIASLDQKSAPTFKPLGPVRQRYKLSKTKHDELCQSKIVMMDVVPIKGYAIVDAMTAATDISDFRRLTTVRILHLVSQRIRAATIPFIGEAALTIPKKIAISAAIEAQYAFLAKRGYLSDYDFKVEISAYDQVMGNVRVYHTFIPALETRRITHTYQFTI